MLAEDNPEQARRLQEILGVSGLLATLLANRGIADPGEAVEFLRPDLKNLHDPNLFRDMDKAVNRIGRAIRGEDKVLLYGDYDVDGISGICFLTKLLKPMMPKRLFYYIPKRMEEGYGLHASVIEKARRRGVSLIITVDCGISSVEAVQAAGSLGMDVIVTDHHEPQGPAPDCLAVINPKLKEEKYPFRNLAGVGVVFKLGQALADKLYVTPGDLWDNLDLVALGTVADIVPLKGENRIFVKYGLDRLNNTKNIGLKALMTATRLQIPINTYQVGYILAPRINATGRLGDPGLSVKLLLTQNQDEAFQLAQDLCSMNEKRQAIEGEVMEEVLAIIRKDPDIFNRYCWVFANEGWHIGVIGIVASKLIEQFYRPVILISLEGEQGRGSGRSIPGFQLFEGLQTCADLFTNFGGHELAAGLTMPRRNVPELQERLSRLARSRLSEEMLVPSLFVEKEVPLAELDLKAYEELGLLEPHGCENPKPALLAQKVNLLHYQPVGENGKHLKIRVKAENKEMEGIGFNMGGWCAELSSANLVDLVFYAEENNWQGKRAVQLNLRDIRIAD